METGLFVGIIPINALQLSSSASMCGSYQSAFFKAHSLNSCISESCVFVEVIARIYARMHSAFCHLSAFDNSSINFFLSSSFLNSIS